MQFNNSNYDSPTQPFKMSYWRICAEVVGVKTAAKVEAEVL